MDNDVRTRMEAAFSADFTGVRIHTTAVSNGLVNQLGARALTTGSHVFFAPGKYGPGTPSGDRLLAHELAHVVQQRAGLVTNPLDRGPHDPLERMADTAADRALAVGSVPRSPAPKASAAPAAGTPAAGRVQRNADEDLAEYIAKDLANYVAQNRLPYAHVLKILTSLDSGIRDNVAADFVETQSDTTLEAFAADLQGRAALDAMSRAMLTGHVTSFETRQAERILHATAGALSKAAYRTKVEDIAALRHEAEDSVVELTVDAIALSVARKLAGLAAQRQYADIRKAIAADSRYEDNVASHFVALQTPAELVAIARDPNGQTMLHFAYEAIITGSVSAWERMQAERILTAMAAAAVPGADDLKRLESPLVFALDSGWSSTATIRAELLTNGQLKVWYDSSIGIHDKQFEQERKTLTDRFGSSALTRGMIMSPDEVVIVKLHNQKGAVKVVPAIKLIDYFNQQKEDTLGKIGTVSIMAATLGVGGVGGAGVLGWVDTISFAISAGSLFVNAYRDDISKTPFGRAFLKAWDAAEGISNYYGWARLGVDGLRLVHAKVAPALTQWRQEVPVGLTSAERQTIAKAQQQAEGWLDAVKQAESAEATKFVQAHPPKRVEGQPGSRHAEIEGGHQVREVSGGLGCELHSTVTPIPCPKELLEHTEPPAGAAADTPGVAPAEAAREAEKASDIARAKVRMAEITEEMGEINKKFGRDRPLAEPAKDQARLRERNNEIMPLRKEFQALKTRIEWLEIPETAGGSYKNMSAKTRRNFSQAHHIPPLDSYDGLIPLSKGDGPSIWMHERDHLKTSSHGSGDKAKKYRQEQAELISQGRFMDAFRRDVQDLRAAGLYDKYKHAIEQAEIYAKGLSDKALLPTPVEAGAAAR